MRRSVIAVVDDDAGVRCALENLLSAYGYRAELFASAKCFLNAAATSEATCLVVDIQLGDSFRGGAGASAFRGGLQISDDIHDRI